MVKASTPSRRTASTAAATTRSTESAFATSQLYTYSYAMDPTGWPDSELKNVAAEIDRLELQRNVYELEMFGLTVVDAAHTGAAALADRAFARVLDLIEERTGRRPDVETGSTHEEIAFPSLHSFVLRDPVFQELMLHPIALALMTVLVGERCVYAASEVFMKGPASTPEGSLQLGLHSDLLMHPEPFASYAQMCNVSWLLSDYTRDNGALAFVPGSHRLRRNPREGEGVDAAVAVEAPKGSLVVWHGNTWHGSYPRRNPGLRTSVAFEVVRCYLDRHHVVDADVTDEALEGQPRLATLLGRGLVHWGEDGPDYRLLAARPRIPTLFS